MPFARIRLRASTYTRKIIWPYRSTDRCFKASCKVNSGAGCCLALGAMTLTGFAVCAHNFSRINLYAQDHTLLFPIAMGFLLQIRMSWLRALSKGCRCWRWCCGLGCCELAERTFKIGGGSGRALAPLPVLSAGKARRRWCQLVLRAVEAP